MKSIIVNGQRTAAAYWASKLSNSSRIACREKE